MTTDKLLLAVAKMLVAECSRCGGSSSFFVAIDEYGCPVSQPCPRCKELREAIKEVET